MNKYFKLGKKLFPICRSITGLGAKKTLQIIQKEFSNLKIYKIKSGKKIYDWKIPPEWNIKDAYVVDKKGKKIINFKKSNLHVVSYSTPVKKTINKTFLLKHLHSLPNQVNAIPYKTSYYKKYWGFCISDNEKKKIIKNYNNSDKFKILIDSNLNKKGYLNYGELIIKGKSKQEILVSTYICHPSMANDGLSGLMVAMGLINYFKKYKNLEKTLRFIFVPETIGSITYINRNLKNLKKNVIGGYHLTCIGDERQHSCKLSKYGNSLSDKALLQAYRVLKIRFKKYSCLNPGSDEGRFGSPGIDLPITSIFRSKYLEYPEYHTSLDNFNVVTLKGLNGGYKVSKKAIKILLKKIIPKNTILCPPQMSKRGLYPTLASKNFFEYKISRNYLDFLHYSDGKNDLLEMSKILKLDNTVIFKINKILLKRKLLTN